MELILISGKVGRVNDQSDLLKSGMGWAEMMIL